MCLRLCRVIYYERWLYCCRANTCSLDLCRHLLISLGRSPSLSDRLRPMQSPHPKQPGPTHAAYSSPTPSHRHHPHPPFSPHRSHTHTMHTIAVKPKRLNQPMLGPSLYRRPSYTMYIALVFAASPDVFGYHASETIGFTNAFDLLAPTRFQNHWFSHRFSIVCTHMLPKTLPVPALTTF